MEVAPDSVLSTKLRFITEHTKAFPHDPQLLPSPNDHCSLVAVAPRYGLVFAGLGTSFKVFQTQALLGDGEKKALAEVETGAPVTHLTASSDGLTVMAVVVHQDAPHALFYEVRSFLPQCPSQTPFASVRVGWAKGARVAGLAWNPMDPCSVALAVTPNTLAVLTIGEDKVAVKDIEKNACAVGWSPKGKQLTVGLADGSLALYKPDLTPVRAIPRPPMDELGAVLSVTWINNSDFFISYKLEAEEGGHVLMFINAPKGKEAKYVLYEFLCNDNQGPRPAMFYPVFIPDWNVMCVVSSRAIQAGVLGRPEGGGEGWIEYEMEEGSGAGLHNVTVTQETYALGMAVDYTSLKSFTNKDQSTSGPCPVLYALSTGGELNMFHLVNNTPGAQPLTSIAEAQPKTGHRTHQQYQASASYVVPAGAAAAPVPAPASAAAAAASPAPAAAPSLPSFSSLGGTPGGSLFQPAANNAATPKAAPFAVASNMFSGLSLPGTKPASTAAPASLFQSPATTAPTTQAPSAPSAPASSPFTFNSAMFSGGGQSPAKVATPAAPATTLFQPAASTLFQPASTPTSFLANTNTPTFQFDAGSKIGGESTPKPSFTLPQPTDPAKTTNPPVDLSASVAKSDTGSISQGRPVAAPFTSTPLKVPSPVPVKVPTPAPVKVPTPTPVKAPTPTPVKAATPTPFKAATPKPTEALAVNTKESEVDLLPTITAITAGFEKELNLHVSNNQYHVEVGKKDEMGDIRKSLVEERVWIEQMSSTTGELKSEVAQLHSRVLEGYTLREECEGQLNKRKNPRHVMSLQSRPLDPQSRKHLEEIRCRYQYLQSQLAEVNTRLHLDWTEFNNAANNKKKKQLPASATLYHALMRNHSFRTALEKQLDDVCDKVKALHLHSLSGSLPGAFHDDEEVFASLERSMRQTSLNSPVAVAPVKMLPRDKQERLQRLLAQRTTVPVRKNQGIPKMDLSSLNTSSVGDNSSLYVNNTLSSPRLDVSSFGPHTFSTPNRSSSSGVVKPQYEDISPPQTPSTKAAEPPKAPSPLLALSSMVSKVEDSEAVKESEVAGDAPAFTFKPAPTGFNAPSSSSFSLPATTTSSTFSLPATTTSSTFSLPATTTSSTFSLPATTTSSTFSLPATTQAGFASTSISSGFSFKPPAGGTSLFGSTPASTITTSAPSLFGANSTISFNAATTTAASLFTTATTASPFTLSSTATTTTPASPFTATPATSGTTISLAATTSTPKLSFGAVTVTPVAEKKSEGSSQPASLFGGSTATQSGSLFSGLSAKSLFSTPSTATSTVTSTGSGVAVKSLFSSTSEVKTGDAAAETLDKCDKESVAESSSASTTSAGVFSETLQGMLTGSSLFSSASPSAAPAKSATVTTNTTTASGTLFASFTSATPSATLSGGSVFGTAKNNSLFGSSSTSALQSALTAPSSSAPSVFSTPASTPASTCATATTTTTTTSFFGTAAISSPAPGSLFAASTPASTPSSTPASTSMFGAVKTSTSSGSSLFGGLSTTPAASTPAASTPAASTPAASTPASTAASSGSGIIFGTASTTSVTSSSLSSSTATSTSSGLFGAASGSVFGSVAPVSAAATVTSSGSIFGTAVSSSSSSGSLFGSAPSSGAAAAADTSSGGSIFGTAVSAPASSGSLFGATTTTSAPASGSLFGATTSAPSSSGSLFGATTSTPASSGSLFGATPTTSAPASGSLFGSTPSTSAPASSGSLFGSTPSTSAPAFGSTSMFGTATTTSGSAFSALSSSGGFSFSTATTSTSASSGSLFGQTSQGSTSVFGQSTPTSSTSLFGGQNTTSTSVFGGGGQPSSPSVFGGGGQATSSASVFGGGSQPTSSASVFGGGQASSPSVFGGGGAQSPSVFGGSGASSGGLFGGGGGQGGSVFGGGAAASPGFGGSSTFGQSQAQPASPFGTPSGDNNSGSVFGGNTFGSGGGMAFGGLGGKPSEENANKNVFGAVNFGAAKPQTGLFGGGSQASSPGIFGGGGGFGSNGGGGGAFSNTQANQGTFGAATTPQKPGGFGAAATFGSSPAFGASPVFGSPPKFGSTAGFGASPSFGSSPAPAGGGAGVFGSFGSTPATPASPGFGGLSGQQDSSAMSFGSIAQNTGSAFGGQAFGSGSSFSSWR